VVSEYAFTNFSGHDLLLIFWNIIEPKQLMRRLRSFFDVCPENKPVKTVWSKINQPKHQRKPDRKNKTLLSSRLPLFPRPLSSHPWARVRWHIVLWTLSGFEGSFSVNMWRPVEGNKGVEKGLFGWVLLL